MTPLYRSITILAALLCAGGASRLCPARAEVMDSAKRPQPAQAEQPEPARPDNPHYDWSKMSPIDFLNMLASSRSTYVIIAAGNEPPAGWLKSEHIEQLLTHIGSNQRAPSVLSANSPYLPDKPSTLGTESMYLIEGFRSNRYPPTMCSVYDFHPSPADYVNWWSGHAPRPASGPRTQKRNGGYIVALNSPTRADITSDSKTSDLSILDQLLYSQDSFGAGMSTTQVLIGRLTNQVEYVWSPPYKLYLRPKFVLPNAQALYDRAKGNGS